MGMGGLSTAGGTRRGRRGRGGRAPMGEINVTPLVDVMLVLLIIFMVTAPLLVSAVPVDLPDSRAKPVASTPAEPVAISIDAQGRLFIGEAPVTAAALPGRLAAIADADANAVAGGAEPRQIMLRADRTLDYGRVMAVMGELNAAGLTRIALITTGSGGTP